MKFTTTSTIFLCLSFFLLLSACKKKSLNLEGKIFSTSNQAFINGATLTIGDKKITTNEKGEYSITGLGINTDYVLTIMHADYVTITRRVKFSVNQKASSNFTLIPREKAQLIDAGGTTTTTFSHGGSIIISPNSFVTQSGKSYKGKVSLRTTFINPKDNSIIAGAPATFISSTNQPLQSYGMLDIYATTPEGERLEITEKTPIRISLPNFSGATRDVGLYSVATTSGLWTRQGSLTYNAETNTLLGQVTSISSAWNADDPCSAATICVRVQVKDNNGNPQPNRTFSIKGISYAGWYGPYYSDAGGFANLQVCPGQAFKLVDDLVVCCVPSNPGCCANGGWIDIATIDMNTVTLTPPCTFLGSFTYPY